MKWEKKPVPQDLVKALAEKYGCDLLTASIFLRRGISTGGEIRYFMESDPRYLRNPFLLPGMEDAVERILSAREEGEKVLVFGDRDVDGITATVLLTEALQRMDMDVSWRIPTGDDPYGLSMKAVDDFAAAYGTLIITVDCGVSNRNEVAHAAELGVDVVVVDHHNLPQVLPAAVTIVNPKLENEPGFPPYPFKNLSGCGVACKLAQALRFARKSEVYGQAVCLLNIRPVNEAYIIEIAKLRNLAVIDTLTETVVPGMVKISDTRILSFLSGQQILTWDEGQQKKLFSAVFGNGVELQVLDIAPEAGKIIPQAAGKSLFRLKEISRIGRYVDGGISELDVLVNLFISFVQQKENGSLSLDEEEGADLQLAALGTIADIMPLRDENRLIVRWGIDSMLQKARPGLSDLLYKQDLAGRRINAEDISWQLTPVINAAGRMGSPEKAVTLLLGGAPAERELLASEVSAMNEERKKLGEEIWIKAEPEAAKSLEQFSGNLVMVSGEGIARGITGIIASRLAKRFNVPALVVSRNENTATGSLRSARDYDLRFLLEQCGDLFVDWGGHDFAAGFSMEMANWDAFLERVKMAAAHMELPPEVEDVLVVDAELPLPYLSRFEEDPRQKGKKDLYVLVLNDRFEPYGEQNRPLLFLSRGLKITDIMLMGKEGLKHVKLTLDTGEAGSLRWPAVYWNAAEKVKVEFDLGDRVDVVYNLNRNWFNGTETPQMMVRDLRRSDHAKNL